ncbi:MAG TPA: phosphatase PAP2 family protein [Acidimicrobiales bacterium]|nr:phosphatase PAP2 family protein [Acidimicrobiales bacterium]
MHRIDASLFRAVNRLADRTGWAHGPAVADAKYGIVLFAVLLLVGWWEARRAGDLDAVAAAVWAGAGTLVAVGVNQILGQAVGRARPYAAMPTVHVLIAKTGDFSFPSDHAVAVGAVAAGLLFVDRRLGVLAAVLAVVLAAARVYVGAHYPGDVLAGLVVGAAVVVAGGLVAVPVLRSLVGALDRSPLRPLVSGRTSQVPEPAGRRS